MRGSRNFRLGGGGGRGGGFQVHLAKKSSDNVFIIIIIFISFFSPQFILQKSGGYFPRQQSFSKVLVGWTIFLGGPTISRGGGGVQQFFPYTNPYNL